jgi:UDP-glucose 4-epimerase
MKHIRALVTGGAGFLGSQLVRRLIPLADRIYVLDDLSTGNADAIPSSPNVTFIHGSIMNRKRLEDILPNVDHVFHLACSNLVISTQDMERDFQTNLYGGLVLLRKTAERCTGLRRFVYTSTASVYGNASVIPTPETDHSVSLPYAASKFGAEHYCRVFHHLHGMPVTVLRLSNVYGPGQLATNPYCGVVAKFFEAIAQGEPLTVRVDGKQTRDLTYVDDAMDAILLAADHPNAVGQLYNVGTGRETSVGTLARLVMSIYGRDDYPVVYKPGRTSDTVLRRAVDPAKIRRELGWQTAVPVEEGLRRTKRWLEGE